MRSPADDRPVDGTRLLSAAAVVAIPAGVIGLVTDHARPAQLLLLTACLLAVAAIVRVVRQAIREIREDG